MNTILDEIAEYKKALVEECKRRVPLEEIRTRGREQGATRDFAGALRASGMSLIAEIKRRSPSRGVVRKDVDPGEVAKLYETHGARAISVWTDERDFGGRLEDLSAVRDAVNLPLLRKEFVVDAYQIYEAKAAGAAAILLTVSLLTRQAQLD